MGFIMGAMKSSMDNNKKFNGLTKGRPGRQNGPSPDTVGFVMGTLKDSFGPTMDNRKKYNGLTRGRPGRYDESSFGNNDRQFGSSPYSDRNGYDMQSGVVYGDRYEQDQRAYGGSRQGRRQRGHRSRRDVPPIGNDQPPPYSNTPQSAWADRSMNNSQRLPMAPSPYPGPYDENDGSHGFRPIVLPQVANGKDSPFLRGYSNELQQYGVSESEFIRIVDAINVANVQNPELQLVQKAASIGGWFVPGLGSLGLMAGQVGVGLAAAYGHKSGIMKVLSNANLEIFVPRGLELWIGKTTDLDEYLGLPSDRYRPSPSGDLSFPEDQLMAYGNSVARITSVAQGAGPNGRKDPIAMIGQRMSQKENERSMNRAQKQLGRGRNKGMSEMQNSCQWIIVMEATESAQEVYRNTLREREQQQRSIEDMERYRSGMERSNQYQPEYRP